MSDFDTLFIPKPVQLQWIFIQCLPNTVALKLVKSTTHKEIPKVLSKDRVGII